MLIKIRNIMDEKKAEVYKQHLETYYGRILLNHNHSRVRAILAGLNPAPQEVEVQPSSVCNANCLWCFGADYEKCENRLYKPKNMQRVIEQVLEFENDGFRIDVLKFCGSTGEPLMNPQTLYAIEQAYGKINLRLFTNGLAIGLHKNDEAYLSTLAKVGRINLSLDALSTETLHTLKPGSKKRNVSMEDILEGASKILAIKEGKGIEAGFVITEGNYKEIGEFARAVKDFRAAENIRYRIDMTDAEVSRKHSREIEDLLLEAKSHETPDFRVLQIHSNEDIAKTERESFSSKGCGLKCSTSKFWTCIGSNGWVYPCGHIASGNSINYGNLLKSSFKEIWNSERRRRMIQILPYEDCHLCSPFSLVTNKVMSDLETQGISAKEIEELHKNFVVNPKRQEAAA
jgi:radical SAM protein with 4Fe4S-binding SPASM domain